MVIIYRAFTNDCNFYFLINLFKLFYNEYRINKLNYIHIKISLWACESLTTKYPRHQNKRHTLFSLFFGTSLVVLSVPKILAIKIENSLRKRQINLMDSHVVASHIHHFTHFGGISCFILNCWLSISSLLIMIYKRRHLMKMSNFFYNLDKSFHWH